MWSLDERRQSGANMRRNDDYAQGAVKNNVYQRREEMTDRREVSQGFNNQYPKQSEYRSRNSDNSGARRTESEQGSQWNHMNIMGGNRQGENGVPTRGQLMD